MISTKAIQEKRKTYEVARLTAKELQDEDNPKSFPREIEVLEAEILTLQKKLDEPSRLYEAYLTQLIEWEKDRLEIVGLTEKPGTLSYYEARLNEVSTFPIHLAALEKQRIKLVQDIDAKIEALVNTYQELYKPVRET